MKSLHQKMQLWGLPTIKATKPDTTRHSGKKTSSCTIFHWTVARRLFLDSTALRRAGRWSRAPTTRRGSNSREHHPRHPRSNTSAGGESGVPTTRGRTPTAKRKAASDVGTPKYLLAKRKSNLELLRWLGSVRCFWVATLGCRRPESFV